MTTIKVEIENDYDNYFAILVGSWIRRKMLSGKPFIHSTVIIDAGPWRSAAVVVYESADKTTVKLEFYSALRAGFGTLSEDETERIIELL